MIRYDMINLLTAIGLSPVAVEQYTFTHKQYIKVKVKAVCGSYSTAALRHIVLLPE